VYVRVDNGIMPAERLDDFLAFIGEALVPAVRRYPGYRSLTASVDRTAGAISVATVWEREADRQAADAAFAVVLRRASEFGMRPVRIDLYEQVLLDLP
jgi:hypothetical protein